MATKGFNRRSLQSCIERAKSSLPVPLSPKSSTVDLLAAAFFASSMMAPHGGAIACHQVIATAQLLGEELDILFELGAVEGLFDHHGQVFRVERLGDEVVGAGFDRFDGALDAAMGGDQNHRQVLVRLAHVAQHFDAVNVGHLIVEQD